MKKCTSIGFIIAAAVIMSLSCSEKPVQQAGSPYQDLISFFSSWRDFTVPAVNGYVPDYSKAAMDRQKQGIARYRRQLAAIDTTGWTVSHRVDWEIVNAEINGLAFDHDILRPWEKNPLFYAVIQMDEPDVPARELPEMYGVLNMFEHEFPLSPESRRTVLNKLQAVPAILTQAETNLTGLTVSFCDFGIRAKQAESRQLQALADRLDTTAPDIAEAALQAKAAVDNFALWLEKEKAGKPEFSGIGIDAFNRYMKEVHLVPFTWQQQVDLMERELARSLAALAMQENSSRYLPRLTPAQSLQEMQGLMKKNTARFMAFIKEEEIFTVPEYMHLEVPVNSFIPEDKLDFFYHIYYRAPLPLLCHQIHWLEKQRELRNNHPIRGTALLSKIWDSRAEGLATNFEELMMHAGILDHDPREKEFTWILLAFRAARALGGLKLHAGQWTLDQAMEFGSQYTPNGFAAPDSPMLYGDYALYMSQPGYGTSYVYGKAQLDRLIAGQRMELGRKFSLRNFFDDYFSRGIIPASLIYWEMTGKEDEMEKLRL